MFYSTIKFYYPTMYIITLHSFFFVFWYFIFFFEFKVGECNGPSFGSLCYHMDG